MILGIIARLRMRVEEDLDGSESRWNLSPTTYLVRQKVIPIIQKYAKGAVLDVGCGRLPIVPYVRDQVDSYDGLDIERRSQHTRFIGDAQDMKDIPDASYDTIVSVSALEHMPKPWLAIAEMRRVCKPGGTVILAVPSMSRLHEEPHDYFRFTHHGLRAMGEAAGLAVVSMDPVGGLFSFLGHQVSTVIVCLGWAMPILKWLVFYFNYWFVLRPCVLLDRLFVTDSKLPMGIIGVFKLARED